jgi:hypothetical protein
MQSSRFVTFGLRPVGLIQGEKVSSALGRIRRGEQASHFSSLPPRILKIFMQLLGNHLIFFCYNTSGEQTV